VLPLVLMGCGGPSYDVAAWQARTAVARPEAERGASDLAAVDALRAEGKLADARDLALQLVAEAPEAAPRLFAASRAESDAVLIFLPEEKEQRALAALSALDYATRADARAAESATTDQLGQLAWSLGTSTHLRPMFARSEHARQTLAAIDRALALDPAQPRALATKALLNYRLATLPWIAKVMARSAPESSLEAALEAARAAVAAEPSVEYRLILAKIEAAAGNTDAAKATLQAALDAPDTYPRDAASREPARLQLRLLDGEGYPE
jgi:tetratricopeptide (TPR) repeat protein